MLTPNNVKYYGAKGDGVTDDTTSIQAAINANINGSALFFPAGTYIVTQLAVSNARGLLLYGTGSASTIRRSASTVASVSNMLSITSSTNVTVTDLNFFSNITLGLSNSIFLDNCVAFIDCLSVKVENCFFYPGYASAVFVLRTSSSQILANVQYGQALVPQRIIGQTRTTGAIYIADGSNNCIISDNRIRSAYVGILVQAISNGTSITNVVIDSNSISNCVAYGIAIYNNNLNLNGTGIVSGCTVSANAIDYVYGSTTNSISGNLDFGSCIYLQGGENSIVSGNVLSYCNLLTNGTLLTPSAIGIANMNAVTITANTIREPTKHAIMLANPQRFGNSSGSSISNNIIYCGAGCSNTAINLIDFNNVAITSNQITGASVYGIRTSISAATCNNIAISSNMISVTSISIGSISIEGSTYVTIIGNVLSSATAISGTAIVLQSAANHVVVENNVILRYQRGVRIVSTSGNNIYVNSNAAISSGAAYLFDLNPGSALANVGFGPTELLTGIGSPVRTATISTNTIDVRGARLLFVSGSASPSVTTLSNGFPLQTITIRNTATTGDINFTNSTTIILNNVASLALAPGAAASFICSNSVAPLVWYQT